MPTRTANAAVKRMRIFTGPSHFEKPKMLHVLRFPEGRGHFRTGLKNRQEASTSQQPHQHRAAAANFVADLDEDFHAGAGRYQHIGARTELDHANALAGLKLVAGFEPADNAAGNGPGDLFDAHGPAAGFFQINPELPVLDGAVRIAGIEKRAGEIANTDHACAARTAVDVDVEDGQKDADAQGSAAGEVRFGDFFDMGDLAVRRANQGGWIIRDGPFRIAEK